MGLLSGDSGESILEATTRCSSALSAGPYSRAGTPQGASWGRYRPASPAPAKFNPLLD